MIYPQKFKVKKEVPLSSLSTFAIGGNVKELIEVISPAALIEAASYLDKRHKPYKVFAGGTNIVFPDQGLDLAIRIFGGKINVDSSTITVDAGVLLSEVVSSSINNGLAGLEQLSGIPGTVGGGVVGNAGAYGRSIAQVVDKVEIWDGKKRFWLSRQQCQFKYRHSLFKEKPLLVLKTSFIFQKGNTDKLKQVSKEIIRLREKKYPPGLKCPGSFFKNILVENLSSGSLSLIDKSKIIDGKISAGYLLEKVAAKGMQTGDIKVSDFHGNLLINCGKGKAEQVKRLALILKEKVYQKFKIQLEEEIRYF